MVVALEFQRWVHYHQHDQLILTLYEWMSPTVLNQQQRGLVQSLWGQKVRMMLMMLMKVEVEEVSILLLNDGRPVQPVWGIQSHPKAKGWRRTKTKEVLQLALSRRKKQARKCSPSSQDPRSHDHCRCSEDGDAAVAAVEVHRSGHRCRHHETRAVVDDGCQVQAAVHATQDVVNGLQAQQQTHP